MKRSVSMWLFAGILSGACGGDDGPHLGVADSEVLGDLPVDTIARVCLNLYPWWSKHAGEVHPALCRYQALTSALANSPQSDGALQAACQVAYDSCLTSATLTQLVRHDPGAQALQCGAPTLSCRTTAGDYTRCLAALSDYAEDDAFNLPSCGEAKTDVVKRFPQLAAAPAAPPPACVTVANQCPELASTDLPGLPVRP